MALYLARVAACEDRLGRLSDGCSCSTETLILAGNLRQMCFIQTPGYEQLPKTPIQLLKLNISVQRTRPWDSDSVKSDWSSSFTMSKEHIDQVFLTDSAAFGNISQTYIDPIYTCCLFFPIAYNDYVPAPPTGHQLKPVRAFPNPPKETCWKVLVYCIP